MDNPQRYGWEHLTYIAVVIVVAFLVLFFAKKYAKTEKAKTIVVKCLAGVLLIFIVTNRWSIVFKTDPPEWNWLLPNSLCGLTSAVLALSVLLGKKDNPALHFVWLIALLGGTIVTFYPDFLSQNPSFMYLPTISGLLHHSFSAIVAVSLFVFDYIHLSYKKWYCILLGFACYLAVGAFFVSVMGYGDALHMKDPILENTPLTIWVVAPMYMAVYGLIILVVELVRKKKEIENKQIEEET